jgi:hypothetical protein
MVRDGNTNPNRNFPERPQQRPPESTIFHAVAACAIDLKLQRSVTL